MNNTSAASFFLVTRVMLEQTCYRRHPGKKTQCMRGAMANSGLVCQDCHGNMAQVGNDFTRDVSPANPGAFELAVDFYNNPDTPRVPGPTNRAAAAVIRAAPQTTWLQISSKDTRARLLSAPFVTRAALISKTSRMRCRSTA